MVRIDACEGLAASVGRADSVAVGSSHQDFLPGEASG
jgi:hypothetical protein